MSLEQVPEFLREHYQVEEWRHAVAILNADFPEEWADIFDVLTEFRLFRSEIRKPGGRKSDVSTRIDAALENRGWFEQSFETKIVVDDTTLESPTHKCPILVFGITSKLYVED